MAARIGSAKLVTQAGMGVAVCVGRGVCVGVALGLRLRADVVVGCGVFEAVKVGVTDGGNGRIASLYIPINSNTQTSPQPPTMPTINAGNLRLSNCTSSTALGGLSMLAPLRA